MTQPLGTPGGERQGNHEGIPSWRPPLDEALTYSAKSRSYRKPYGLSMSTFRGRWNNSISPNVGPRLAKYQFWTNICDDTIPWPHPEAARVEKSLYNAWTLKEWNIPRLKDASYECHLMVFKEKLAFWDQILEGRDSFMPPIEVAKRCILLGPEFSKSIKDAIEHNLRYHTSSIDDAVFDDIDDKAWGHDYFFSPRDCINFRIPDDHADIERLLEKPPSIDPALLSKFKEYVAEYIHVPSHKVELDDLDYLSMFTQTSTFDDPYKVSGKSRHKNYLSRIGKTIRGGFPLEFEYVPVQKNAAESRAAVVPSPETLYEIKKFHKMFKAVANCPEDQYYNSGVLEGLETFLTCGYSRRVGYIMSDIKKSGLTFNRNIHDAIIEVLHELMPTWGWDKFLDYGRAYITLPHKNSRVRIRNGYGLGMLDCVISFTQAIVYNMWIDSTDVYGYRLTAKFWSDDSVIKVRSTPDHDLDNEKLGDLMSSFNAYAKSMGLVIHNEKPYYSRKGVFLETYGSYYKDPWDHTKKGQYIGCLFDTLKAPSIYRAKEMFAALCLEIPQSLRAWLTTAMDIIIPFWGYELHKDEVLFPFEMGGWTYFIEDGLNMFCEIVQTIADEDRFEPLTKMCLWHHPRPKLLKAHKDHEKWIGSILDMGWNQDPSALSWRTMATGTLKQDYKRTVEVVDREKRILRSRQDFYKRMQKDRSITGYGAVLQFWDDAKKGGWYFPPAAAIKKGVFPTLYEPYNDPTWVKSKISVNRAYLHLTKQRGANLKICDPYVSYTSNFDVCSDMLNSISGGKHMHLSNAVFVLANGYSETSFMKKVEDRYGPGAFMKDSGPDTQLITELIRDSMKPTSGDYVFPLRGYPTSILTRYEGADHNSRWKSWDCEDGFAMAYGHPDPAWISENLPGIPLIAQSITAELLEARNVRKRYAQASHSHNVEDSLLPDDIKSKLRYTVAMIEGYTRQAILALNPDYNAYGDTSADAVMGADIGYDSDISLGDMFG
jgi:hypothetical protein